MSNLTSWGKLPQAQHVAWPMNRRGQALPDLPAGHTMLPFGLGRSYGDSCLNDGGVLLTTPGLNRYIHLDPESGVLTCEGGVTFDDIIQTLLPRGWFLPVTPGTRFITVGGAIANDIHGKNHHTAGSFGCHVLGFELLRSDGSRRWCSPTENTDFFEATIGGLGLTGLITSAQFQLIPSYGPWYSVTHTRFANLTGFFEVDAQYRETAPYTVAWVDCVARGKQLGRGIYMSGNAAPPADQGKLAKAAKAKRFPMNAPSWLLNGHTVRAFNQAYFHKESARPRTFTSHYEPFFYPLDAVLDWNKLYGKSGFYQYQCVVPYDGARDPIREIIDRIAHSGQGSFLAVLKTFGDRTSPGWLSFPRRGITLALDFPNRGATTEKLFQELDDVVRQVKGALYPAKDARMPGDLFQSAFPRWRELDALRDPLFSSSFWRRVTGDLEPTSSETP